jgi:hypothetical protein
MIAKFQRQSVASNSRYDRYREKLSRKYTSEDFLLAMHETTIQLLADRLSNMNVSNQDGDNDNQTSDGTENSAFTALIQFFLKGIILINRFFFRLPHNFRFQGTGCTK